MKHRERKCKSRETHISRLLDTDQSIGKWGRSYLFAALKQFTSTFISSEISYISYFQNYVCVGILPTINKNLSFRVSLQHRFSALSLVYSSTRGGEMSGGSILRVASRSAECLCCFSLRTVLFAFSSRTYQMMRLRMLHQGMMNFEVQSC